MKGKTRLIILCFALVILLTTAVGILSGPASSLLPEPIVHYVWPLLGIVILLLIGVIVDMGYVDADVLADSSIHYQVDLVGPVQPDVSWQAQDAERFDHSQFTIDWQAQQVTCPASCTSQSWGTSYDRHRKNGHSGEISSGYLSGVSLPCSMHTQSSTRADLAS